MTRKAMLTLALMIPVTAACMQPPGMYREAQVMARNDTVCISVADDEETRDSPPSVAGIWISRNVGDGTIPVWKVDLSLVTPPFVLSPDHCLAMDIELPPGTREEQYEQIRIGEHYSLGINAFVQAFEPDDDGWVNRMYRRNFCVRPGRDKELEVVLVPWGAGRPQWELCEIAPQ